MVGDSLMRYQFLSLIHWLELGVWPPPTTGTPEHPSPVIEAEWAINEQDGESWPRFFRGALLSWDGWSSRVWGCRNGPVCALHVAGALGTKSDKHEPILPGM